MGFFDVFLWLFFGVNGVSGTFYLGMGYKYFRETEKHTSKQ